MYSIYSDHTLPLALRNCFTPPANEQETTILKWLREMRINYLKSIEDSPNYRKYQEAMSLLAGKREADDRQNQKQEGDGETAGDMSPLRFEATKRNMLEMVATLSDVNPEASFSTEDESYKPQVKILDGYYDGSWNHPDTRIRKVMCELMTYAICSEAYLETVWESDPFRRKLPGLKYNAYSIEEVYFSEVPKGKDIQQIHCTTIRREVPLTIACMLYPKHASHFVVDNTKPSWIRRAIAGAQKYTSWALQASFEDEQRRGEMSTLSTKSGTVNIYYSYVLDISYNNTGKVVTMGRGTPGEYDVPFEGQELDTGLVDPTTRTPITRKADCSDAMLYPYRRLIIHTDKHIISDGPSPWAHGMTPLTRLALEDWPVDSLGNCTALEGRGLDDSIERLYRAFEDTILNRLSPNLELPEDWGDDTIRAFNPRARGKHMKSSGIAAGKPSPILPYQLYELRQYDLEVVRMMKEERDFVQGKPQMQALAQAAQIPSTKTFEQFLQLAGPYTTHISKNVEDSIQESGMMSAYLIFQYATAKRRFDVLGKKGLTKEDFYYDPTMLDIPRVPSPNAPSSMSIFPVTTIQRASEHAKRFYFRVRTGSAYKLTDKSRQLLILNLSRDPRFPMSPWFLARAMDIDLGGEPDLPNDYEKYLWHLEKMSRFQALIQAQAAMIQAQTMMEIQRAQQMQQAEDMANGLGMLMGGDGGGQPPYPPPPQDPTQRVGRPSSYQDNPRLEEKDGGGRTTVSTS